MLATVALSPFSCPIVLLASSGIVLKSSLNDRFIGVLVGDTSDIVLPTIVELIGIFDSKLLRNESSTGVTLDNGIIVDDNGDDSEIPKLSGIFEVVGV